MATCGRRNRPKIVLGIFGATLVGYLIFSIHSSVDVGARESPRKEVRSGEVAEDELKKPVYEKPPLDLNALGELGRPVKLNLDEEERRKEEESINKHQINTYVSDKISLHRRLAEKWNPLYVMMRLPRQGLPLLSVLSNSFNSLPCTLTAVKT